MQDKIQEIMGLVDDYGSAVEATCSSDGGCAESHAETRAYKAIQSKLRELVREPLSDDVIKMIDDSTHFHESTDWPIRFARAIERAHNITNTSN